MINNLFGNYTNKIRNFQKNVLLLSPTSLFHIRIFFREMNMNKSSVLKKGQTFNMEIPSAIHQGKTLPHHADVNSLLVVEGNKMQSAKENDGNGRADAGHVLQQLQCTN